MDTIPEITGPRLRLRLVTPGDAAFVYGLRTDPAYNAHLSPVTDQTAWIRKSSVVKSSRCNSF